MEKCVVITGAGRGLGRALAARFAERDYTVIGCTASASSLESLQVEFAAPHTFSQVDVSDDGAMGSWAEEQLAAGHVPAYLINNAALINHNAPLWEVPAAEFQRLVDVNICGVHHVIRHWLPAMVERQQGIVVNYSSTWGRTTSPEVAPYCASKFAIEGLTQALAQELPAGMAAVALNPGVIDTDMLRSCFGSAASMYPQADAWSERAIEFLLGLDASHNGQSLSVP